MAASSNKPSPTNRPLDSSDNNAVPAAKDDVGAEAPTVSSPLMEESKKPSVDDTPPTYLSVESSESFLLAKKHLQDGKFEEAMTLIEAALLETQATLKRVLSSPDGDFTLHEAMGPWHYLYGSTLLYSIEETDQDMTTIGSAVSSAVVAGEDGAVAAAAANNNEEGPEEQVARQVATAAEITEEMQIAWDNLETARHIIHTMLTSGSHEEIKEKLELDLAQVHLREGDLQRLNGRNEESVEDYQQCLLLRKKSSALGPFHRKLADTHYNLAMSYIEIAGKLGQQGNESANVAAAATRPPTEEEKRANEVKREVACNKAVFHYLETSKCLFGQIANICDGDPKTILEAKAEEESTGDKPTPKYKTTGEEEDKELVSPKLASAKLRAMRNCADVMVSAASLSPDEKSEVDEMFEMLGDIHETVDEAENSTKGMQEVAKMKAAVSAAAAADGEIGEGPSPEGTTTIGFGAVAAATAGVAVSASVAASATAAEARPMMVVKKKKRAAVQPVDKDDNKKPKPEAE